MYAEINQRASDEIGGYRSAAGESRYEEVQRTASGPVCGRLAAGFTTPPLVHRFP